MADKPQTISKRFQRSDLAQFLPNPRLIKEFDALSADVTETLPTAIADIASDADTVLQLSSFQPRPALPIPNAAAADGVFAVAAFQQRQPQQPLTPEDGASRILSGQIFGA